MTVQEIIKTTAHRPWSIPKGNWKFYQEWNNVVFLHWQVSLTDLKALVPNALEIDLFEGNPWISLVAFTMERVKPRYLPAISPISNFDEINIRTYVKHNNKTGVYFLSIEGGKQISCLLVKQISKLPYRFSTIERSANCDKTYNKHFNDRLFLHYSLANKLQQKTLLDKWLTERYALFQDGKNGINAYEIHHLEWPIQAINLNRLEFYYPRFNHLINSTPSLCHYSSGVQVFAWNRYRI